jgi:hypothetical protein
MEEEGLHPEAAGLHGPEGMLVTRPDAIEKRVAAESKGDRLAEATPGAREDLTRHLLERSRRHDCR